MANRTITFQEKDLKDLLECPVCLMVPREGFVFQCENGHCVCSECHGKLTACPQCRGPIGKMRNLIYEQLLPKIPHYCKFASYGCKEEDINTALESHEKDCKYRLVNCPEVLQCKTQISMVLLLDHMKEKHEGQVPILSNFNLSKPLRLSCKSSNSLTLTKEDKSWTWPPIQIHMNDHHYFLVIFRISNGQFCFGMYMVGSRRECEESIFSVKVFSNDKKEELTYRGPCMSLDMKRDEIVEAGHCITFSNTIAERLMTEDKIISYTINIESSPHH